MNESGSILGGGQASTFVKGKDVFKGGILWLDKRLVELQHSSYIFDGEESRIREVYTCV